MTTPNENIEITLSTELLNVAKSLRKNDEVNFDGVFRRAVNTQAWVEEKQAAGKTIVAATATDSENGPVWSDYEYLSPEPTFEAVTE